MDLETPKGGSQVVIDNASYSGISLSMKISGFVRNIAFFHLPFARSGKVFQVNKSYF